MLLQSAEKTSWLRERDHPAITLPRWQQQVDLLSDCYQADACLILQYHQDEFQVVCSRQATNLGLYAGTQFSDPWLAKELFSYTGYDLLVFNQTGCKHLAQFHQLSALPLYWSDGQVFGAILICNSKRKAQFDRLHPLLETSKALIQAELKHLFLMQQVQMMSLQDELTCMLNPYGFNLMAPRQLSLSRRFGSNAAVVLLEDLNSYPDKLSQTQALRKLARVIHHNMRDADVSARVEDRLFAILAFVDSQANLDALTRRLRKQLAKEDIQHSIAIGSSFFSPRSHLAIEPMVEVAKQNLLTSRVEVQSKITPR
ncbi:GGDEF domain-containing protein [Shewanella sp. Isolate11]|uniref:GGDEF domain-containing protein n=1 Tax=Shewanella sp. Isolate11 TaxID=2908530 RepID=UPI001EFEA996|nr:GGDEF domain-containing protein [Shewanella sp. Isolate11]MCG9695716.1 GGDEF domain-containing protein [Shewanella sp. Isolate11]